MLIYILSRNENLYSTKQLILAGKKAGHTIKIYNHMYCDLLIENGEFYINYDDITLPKPDYIIPRIGANATDVGEKVIRHYEKMGVPTLTSASGLLNSRDKFRSMQILSEATIKMPLTYF